MKELLDAFLATLHNLHTRYEYAAILEHFLVDKTDLATIATDDITAYLEQPSMSRRNAGAQIGPAGAKKRLVVVKAFLTFAGRRDIDFEALYIALPRAPKQPAPARSSVTKAKEILAARVPFLATALMDEDECTIWRRVLADYLEAKRGKSGSASTFTHYRQVLGDFFGADFVKSPENVSQAEVIAFINLPCHGRIHQGQPAAASTRANRLTILKSFYNFAMHYTIPTGSRPRRLLPADFVVPTEGIEPPKRGHRPRALSPEELERIFACIPNDVRGKRDRSFLTFALLSGLRRASLEGLRWKDIEAVTFEDGRRAYVVHYIGKGNRARVRTKELSETAHTLLIGYLRMAGRLEHMQSDSPLWTCIPAWKQIGGRYTRETVVTSQDQPRRAGKYTAETPLSAQAMNEALQHYAAQAGIEKAVSMHVLRHSIALARYRVNRDPLAVMRFLDHSNLSTCAIYLQELDSPLDDYIQVMEARFSFLAPGKEVGS